MSIKIVTKDETGREIPREVKFQYYQRISGDSIPSIHFYGPCEYYVDDLLKHFPFSERFYIDAGGRNHYGSPVYVEPEDMNYVMEEYKKWIEQQEEER